MSTFMGLPDAEYFANRPSPMPAHPSLGVIEPGTTVRASFEGNTIVGRVCYPDELTIQGAEPDWLGLDDGEELPPWDEKPWVVIAIKYPDGNEEETSVFLEDITKVLAPAKI